MVFLVRGTGTAFFSSIWDVRDVLWSFSSGQFHQIPYVNTLIKLNHIPKPTVKGKFSSPSRAEGDRSQLSPTCFEISNMVGSFKEDTVSPKQFLSGDWATHQKHITQSKWVHLLQTFGVKIMLATIWNNHPKRFLALPRSTSKFVPEIAGEFLAATKERSKKKLDWFCRRFSRGQNFEVYHQILSLPNKSIMTQLKGWGFQTEGKIEVSLWEFWLLNKKCPSKNISRGCWPATITVPRGY